MHLLSRQIRFAVEPFADEQKTGANSYCAKPTSEGLAFFFNFWVELKSEVNKDTGFVVNVAQIDKVVRSRTIGLFRNFAAAVCQCRQSSMSDFRRLLSDAWEAIEHDFLPAEINSLSAELMPSRKITIKERTGDMLYFSEKFEFAASHTLWNDKFSEDENFRIFGKCANKCGHGHNYIIEVTIAEHSGGQFSVCDYEQTVDKNFISIVDHKNLNKDVEFFSTANPTVENIAEFAFKCLNGKFSPAKLDSVTVWENDRTFCRYSSS